MSKKMRGPNFTTNEKEILVHLVTKYKDVVENKKTDAVTTAIKNEGWKKLTEEFNSLSTFCVRQTEQIKTCWDNIKRVTRKDRAAVKKQTMLTGGGLPDIPPPGPLQDQVQIILGPTLDGMHNLFDSDAQFHNIKSRDTEVLDAVVLLEKDVTVAPEAIPLPKHSLVLENETAIPTQDMPVASSCQVLDDEDKKVWSGWSPAALKTKVSDTLSIKRKGTPTSSYIQRRRPKTSLHDKLVQSKIELIEIMKRNAEKEAEMKELILAEQLKQEKIKTEKLLSELNTS